MYTFRGGHVPAEAEEFRGDRFFHVAMRGARDVAGRALGRIGLHVERVAYTYNDIPMELRRGLYRTDTHYYRNALS